MPFDFVKTQCQKDRNLSDGTFRILRKYYRMYGIKCLYVGWQFKSLQYFMQSIFTIKALDYLEKKAKLLK